MKLLLATEKYAEVNPVVKEYIFVHSKSTLLCWWACRAAYETEDYVEALHWAKKVSCSGRRREDQRS